LGGEYAFYFRQGRPGARGQHQFRRFVIENAAALLPLPAIDTGWSWLWACWTRSASSALMSCSITVMRAS
jgi:hypothetical protein